MTEDNQNPSCFSVPLRTFLQQQCRGNDRRSDEISAALGYLPSDIPVYEYKGVAQFEATIRADDADSRYSVFINVPLRAVDHDLEDRKNIGTITYYTSLNILLVKMPSASHCEASGMVTLLIADKLTSMGLSSPNEISFMGSVRLAHKEPDAAYRPRKLPKGRDKTWPSVVVETGRAERQSDLENDAQQWFRNSSDLVQTVITIRVTRRTFSVKRFHSRGVHNGYRPELAQMVVVRKGSRKGAQPELPAVRLCFLFVSCS